MFASPVLEPDWQQVGNAVKRRRALLGLHVEQICRIADVSQSTWEQLEAGRRPLPGGGYAPPNPRPATIGRVARGLSVPVRAIEDLIAGDPEALEDWPVPSVVKPLDTFALSTKLEKLSAAQLAKIEALVDEMIPDV